MLYPDPSKPVAVPATNPPVNTTPIPPAFYDAQTFLTSYFGMTPENITPTLLQQTDFAIKAVTAFIRSYTGRNLSYAEYTDTFGTFNGQYRCDVHNGFFSLNEFPVWSILEITSPGGVLTPLNSLDDGLQKSTGIIRYMGYNGIGVGPVSFRYLAGYSPLPADLDLVASEMIKMQLQSMGAMSAITASGGTVTGSTPIKAVTIGTTKVEFAIATSDSASSGGASPLGQKSIDTFGYVLNGYVHPSRLAAF